VQYGGNAAVRAKAPKKARFEKTPTAITKMANAGSNPVQAARLRLKMASCKQKLNKSADSKSGKEFEQVIADSGVHIPKCALCK